MVRPEVSCTPDYRLGNMHQVTGSHSSAPSSARLRVVRKLGRGGMADVYLCRLTGVGGFDKPLVAKVVRPEHAEDADFSRMFLEEARLSARLQHPNLIHVYGIEETGGRLVLMMEYVEGPSLKGLMRGAWRAGDPGWQHVAALISDVARGLAYAHRLTGSDGAPLGLVHRDVSLDNILVSLEGVPKLIDFGIARAADRGRHTQVGTVKGKLQYMAPEQLDGLDVDHRADIYALGVCLYKALSAKNPFPAKTTREVWRLRMVGETIPLSEHRPELPQALVDAVASAMEADPVKRCASAEDLADALEAVALSADPPSTRAARKAWIQRHAPDPADQTDGDGTDDAISLSLMLRGSFGAVPDAAGHAMPDPTARLSSGLPDSGPTDNGVRNTGVPDSTGTTVPGRRAPLLLGLLGGLGIAGLVGLGIVLSRPTDRGDVDAPVAAAPAPAEAAGPAAGGDVDEPADDGLGPSTTGVDDNAPGTSTDGQAAEAVPGDASGAPTAPGAAMDAASTSAGATASADAPVADATPADATADGSAAEGPAADATVADDAVADATVADDAVADAAAADATVADDAVADDAVADDAVADAAAADAAVADDAVADATVPDTTVPDTTADATPEPAAATTAASDALPASVVVRSATELSAAFEAVARAAVADGADSSLVQRGIRAGRDQQLRDFVPGTTMTLRPRTISLFLVEASRAGASASSVAAEIRRGLRDGRFGGVK